MLIKDFIIFNNNNIKLIKRYFLLIYFLLIIKFKGILFNYFEGYQVGFISEQASIIDITDYHNLYLVITTEKNIYTGMPPNKISSTTSKIINITAGATYDSNYVLLACTEDYLLSKININTGEEVPLVNYQQLSLSIENLNYSCSINIYNNTAYIGISQITDNKLNPNIVKIGLKNINESDGPTSSEEFQRHQFKLNLDLADLIYGRQISCEVISRINTINKARLVCGYEKFDKNTNLYRYYVTAVKSNFNSSDKAKQVTSSSTLLSFRLQKIDANYIRYLVTNNSFEIYLNSSDKVNIVKDDERNPFLFKFSSIGDSFFYYNNYIFSTYPTDINNIQNFYLYIKSNISDSYIRFQEKYKYIHNCLGYYDETNDKLELIYQYANNIKYFIVQNMKELFYFECEAKTVETISNQSLTFNVSELMTYPLEHKLLHKDNVVNYPSTNEKIWSYNGNINFNKASQILNVTTGLNDWMTLYFFFKE